MNVPDPSAPQPVSRAPEWRRYLVVAAVSFLVLLALLVVALWIVGEPAEYQFLYEGFD